ncbi:MAG: phosphoribosylformylglycinamidine cyclo-ligase [Parcubacteria group bacterium Gr01-1014_48]|nr:MAG: phosphoribosylformylglycinamidine cyclo-ligase [Parcubacteria group bacterium Greene0416_14]TSC73474.1 MAG: phosphoribosylformylglycinamidine cyclo-ligase [Parcubacteria group bacterium Gr01-1014_48]TSD00559.1 MAG: phosphoribosylformylglycinamidine cyclo-ligase [Parcubacteria group bacterium Greene1014_15]TSD08252.1 MAG: phosphoribosylformylglycinamidine cyclo-ligase [Parcubacteria group bacterium Greene0714_4]
MNSYAKAGVDYTKIAGFKKIMRDLARKTAHFPQRRGVFVSGAITHAHGAIYEYRDKTPCLFVQTIEGLGKKNWIAERMYCFRADGKTYHRGIAIDIALAAVNDCIAHGAMPVILTDKIASPSSAWFTDLSRARDLAFGFEEICRMVGMAIPQGESAVIQDDYEYPIFSGCVTGIVTPLTNLITRDRIEAGDAIIGVASSGLHANGSSLILDVAATLKHDILTPIPRIGKSLGEEALTPTLSYVRLVEALLENRVPLHGIIPGTGGGLSKLAIHDVPYTYVVERSLSVPKIFLFMRSCGVPLRDCLTTFNWGIGYYLFVPKNNVEQTLVIGASAGYKLMQIGFVERGERQVIFEPAGEILMPPESVTEEKFRDSRATGKDPMFGYGSTTPPLPPSSTQKTFE